MIRNDAEFEQTLDQVARLQRGLRKLKQEFADKPNAYALMAEGPLDQLRELQADLEAYTGAAQASHESIPLWVRIVGEGITLGDSPISVLTVVLDTLRKGVQAVTEYVETGQLSSRPTARIKNASDLRVAMLAHGSLQVGFRLPDEEVDGAAPAVRTALDQYLAAARWVASGSSSEALEQAIPDARLRAVILNELSRLVPRQRGAIDAIEIAGRYVKARSAIRLVRESRLRIRQVLQVMQKERVETHTGDLREIDLDSHTFTLRQAGDVREVPCSFPPSLLQTAKEALDRRVQVTGVRPAHEVRRGPYAPLEVTGIEILGEDDE